jgi:putative membrane protein
MMDDYWGHGAGNSNDVWGFVLMVLMMVLVVIGIVVLVRYLSHGAGNAKSGDNALDVLKTRYAKGEIDKKEFDEKRKALSE